MFSRDARRDEDVPDVLEVSEVLEVLIGLDGSAVVDGAPVPVPDDEPVHVAVLDALHRHALARGEPVEAVIHDRREAYATHIEVGPDGSSRILRREQSGTEPQPAGPRPVGLSSAEPQSTDRPSVGPRPAPEASPVKPSPADGTRSAGVPTPVPDQFAGLVRQIVYSIDSGARERAAALAFRLREHTARTFGAEHPYTLEAQALEAFAAYKNGNHQVAVAACLELARIRRRLGDPRAHEELTRAAAAWRLIDDSPSALNHGGALLVV